MKAMKKLFLSAIMILLMITSSLPVFAEGEQPYTYTVTISAGMRGTFNEYTLDSITVVGKSEQQIVKTLNEDQTVITISNLQYGDRLIVDFAIREEKNPITITQTKYNNKGIRKSGHDNDEASINSSIKVTKDEDYVVAYGIAGDMVAYTVYYVNAETRENLLEPQVYYGNIGEKPVVPYQYVEGYLPQAYNLTKTLSENADENVFEFRYTAIPPVETEIITETVTIEIPGEEIVTDEGTIIIPPVINQPENENQPVVGPNQEQERPNQPEEIIDIDDENTPLAKGDENEKDSESINMSVLSPMLQNTWMTGGLFAGAILLILILFILRKRSEEKEEKQE